MHDCHAYNRQVMYAFTVGTAMAPTYHPSVRWLMRLPRDGQPICQRIVDALDAAVRNGELQAGDRLPPQRTVAELLDVDLTTVTRAYAAARGRGLIEGTGGRGHCG